MFRLQSQIVAEMLLCQGKLVSVDINVLNSRLFVPFPFSCWDSRRQFGSGPSSTKADDQTNLQEYETVPHKPVLSDAVMERLQPKPGQTFLDMTFGAGGHTERLFKECPDIKVIALDRDPSVYKYAKSITQKYSSDRFCFYQGKFTDMLRLLANANMPVSEIADGILFDVGVSSMQFDTKKRGFSLAHKGPLDMRMNSEEATPTAGDILNKLEEADLARILKKYGQEKKAKQIARAIVEQRQMLGPLSNTRELQDLVSTVYKNTETNNPKDRLGRTRHPATLTFQALRIFVNDELNELYNGLKIAHRLLKPLGTCAVITFHSLEHNIAHQVFNTADSLIKQTPVTRDLENSKMLWRSSIKPVKPLLLEVDDNSRSRSAELRSAQKL